MDWQAAGADLIRMAKAVGPYEPRLGEGPLNTGGAIYTPSQRLEAYLARQHQRKVSTMVARAQRQAQRETPAG